MTLTTRDLHDALQSVKDPDNGKSLVALGVVRDVRIDEKGVSLSLQVDAPPQVRASLTERVRTAIAALSTARGVVPPAVAVEFVEPFQSPGEATRQRQGEGHDPLPAVKRIIAVGAGKGGVGKSTVASLLAVGLAKRGAKVGLLDGDIYGPSLPTMLGLHDLPSATRGNMLVPFVVHGIKAMSMGKLVDADKALILRGPMAQSAFKQLATQTDWGALDDLIIDLPPGTGDVPLTMSQLLPLSGAVVVCTPQRVAADDARRAVRMFQQLGVEVLGIVENMSGFVGDDGKVYDLFGRGGAEILAQSMGVPYLGALPLHPALRENGDAGTPLRNWEIPTVAAALDAMCANVSGRLALTERGGRAAGPTLSVR